MPFWKDTKFELRSRLIEKSAERNGLRHAIFTVQKDKYIGEWKRDVKSGKGALLTRTNRLYEGDFAGKYRHGFGVFAIQKANKVFDLEYRGDWVNGKRSGYGARYYPDGSYYEGGFLRDKRHGYGQMWYVDGSFYDGDWYRDLRDGLGMFVQTNGNRYEGTWSKGKKHGRGRFFHLNHGQMHDGVWQEDFCNVSSLEDIPFRQTAVEPTPYSILSAEVLKYNEILSIQFEKRLGNERNSCLDIRVEV